MKIDAMRRELSEAKRNAERTSNGRCAIAHLITMNVNIVVKISMSELISDFNGEKSLTWLILNFLFFSSKLFSQNKSQFFLKA